jgi:hypothetical protein
MAGASAPFALTRSGGTPRPANIGRRRKPKEGRVAGGPACVGCAHYQSDTSILTGSGLCIERQKRVAANSRQPCGAYRFHAAEAR